MAEIIRKNSLWKLYGMIGLVLGAYVILFLMESPFASKPSIIIITLFSLIILFSQWSSTIEIVLSDKYFVVRHYIMSKSPKFDYSDLKLVEYIHTRVYGTRLIFKFNDDNSKISEFTIYNPDKELLEFVSSHIKTYKNRVV